jgi:aminopeptidase N
MPIRSAVLLLAAVAAPALAQGQLARGVVPVSYDIAVAPDAKAMTFTGSETVSVDVREATRAVTLNAADLDVTRATWDGQAVSVKTDKDAQTLTVALPAAAAPGRHALAFQYKGVINKAANGLFAIDYTNTDGTPDRMLATQFEAPDARRFAPMWDEPSFKARFRLSATAPAGQLAFSNMPAASVTTNPDGTQLYRFGETPVMSSYLLFLGMGNMERRTVQAGKTEIGVITRKGVSAQGDYALAQAKRLLTYYNDYFGQPYPLPKLDMIAGPGSSQFFGAMENWGAIFYFENEVLFDPKRTTESGRQRIFTVVAHEMAHQWFGDLVTMAWWDDLWLNEGFASWMENKTAADLNPAWQAGAQAVATDREAALGTDSTGATHPIIRHVETVDQIGQAFDEITYQKGEAVIGMMESTLGPDTFRAGIRRYMAKYKYSNTVTDQLWAELSAAANRPVAGIAHDFTLQGGVPLISVVAPSCSGGYTSATLQQGRFGLDEASKKPQAWQVPLVVGAVGGGSASVVATGPVTTARVRGCGAFVANLGKGSYARVIYDDAGHQAIVRDFRKLALNDRLGTLGDDFALAAGGYQDLGRWFAVAGQVDAGASPIEWGMLNGSLGSLLTLYRGTPLEAPLRARRVALLRPELQRIGHQAKPGEAALAAELREQLLSSVGTSGDPEAVAMARRYVTALRSDPTAIPPAIRQSILTIYAWNATSADWDQLLAIAQAEKSPVAKNGLVSLLGAARDEAVARRALGLLESDQITVPQKASLLRTLANTHPDLAFDWAVAHRQLVNGWLETSTAAQYVVALGVGSNDPAMPGKVQAYADKYLPAGSGAPAKRVINAIAVRKATADRLRAATAAWLGAAG